MKRALTVSLAILIISSVCSAVPLGGAGSMTRQSIKGSLEVQGTLSVDGRTVLNGKEYFWPRTKDITKPGSVLKNSGNGNLIWSPEVSPAGDEGAVQLNTGGDFSSDAALVWNRSEKALYIGGLPASVSGHSHAPADIKGVIPVTSGGTGSDNGSITGTGELVLSSGGENKNIVLSPSGSGSVILGASGMISTGPVRSETGFNTKGADGTSDTYAILSDIKIENNTLFKRTRTITVSGGIVTSIGPESAWTESGAVSIPQPQQ